MQRLLGRLSGDRGIWLMIILLMLVGVLATYSASSSVAFRNSGGDTERYLLRHLGFLALGFGVMYLTSRADYRLFARFSKLLIVLSVGLLAYNQLFGVRIGDQAATRWISVMGISFQPSDLAKFSLMVYLARLLTENQEQIKDFYRGFIPAIAWVVVICGLILPSNLSTAALCFVVSILLMYIAGISLRHMLGMAGLGAVMVLLLLSLGMLGRASTWKSRIDNYTSSWTDPDHEPSFQTQQANIAIASGGWVGRGSGKSLQRNYLPEAHADFIYAIILEEYGLLGGVVVMALYLIVLFRSVAIVTVSKTFGALLAAGLSFLIVIQALVNMGVTTGLLPVTGLTLPLISMGGTSILFTCLSFGVILAVSRSALQNRRLAVS
ncbi:MAG: putative peptidoglycan glycosyltransferase FtsW [Bacteroidia bacterium]|nr:putative peptidoglycan glycosyltransferase FtsW [Bacteroidia bacterium]